MQDFANRGATHAQLFRQLALYEPFAGRESVAQDQVAKMIRHGLLHRLVDQG